MIKHKRIRERGKLKLGKLFQELKEGDNVAIVRNLSFEANFPKRLQGRSGTIIGKQGKAFIISLMDGNEGKKLIVKKVHLKKLK